MVKEIKKKKFSLDTRVRAIAESGSGKGVKMPKWFTVPQNKERRALHISICEALAKLSTNNGNYPITYLVYFAVGKNAHRKEVFENGYTKINESKAEKIFSWLRLFAKHHKNEKFFRNANVAHAICAYYDKVSTKTKDFSAALKGMESNASLKIKNANGVMKALGIVKKTEEDEVANAEVAMEPAMAEA